MKGTVIKSLPFDSIDIPQEMLAVHVDPLQVEASLQRLRLRYAKESDADTVQKGDLVYCKADASRYPDDRTVLIYTGTAIPGAEAAAEAALGHASGDTFAPPLMDVPTELTIQRILRRTPVEITDSLIREISIEGVETVAQYRDYLAAKALKDRQSEQKKEITRYLLEQAIAGSTFSYDEKEMEDYIETFIREYMAAYGDEIQESPEELRSFAIDRKKQDWLAETFCKERGIEIDRAAAEEDAAQMREMMMLMGEDIPDQDELVEMSVQNEYYTHFFNHIDEVIAKKMGGTNGND